MSFFKRKKKPENNRCGWFGDYKDWNELVALSGGYESDTILNKTRDSILKIKNGEAVYERDSVLFDIEIYPYAVITALLYAAINCNNNLNVIDFGGSLGSTYYQVRDFIPSALNVHWNVVEQKDYVDCGKNIFEDQFLKFHPTIAVGEQEIHIDNRVQGYDKGFLLIRK